MAAVPVLPTIANLAPAAVAKLPAAPADGGADVSFEAVLEAQMGLPPGLLADLASTPSTPPDGDNSVQQPASPKRAEGHDADASGQTTAELLFLPAAAPVAPAASGSGKSAPAETEAVAAMDGNPPALPGVASGPAGSHPEDLRKLPDKMANADAAGPALQAAPASVAETLQSLPAAGPAGDKPATPVARLAPSGATTADTPIPAIASPAAHHPDSAVAEAAHVDAAIPGIVGDARWGDALSDRVVWMAGQKIQSAEFRVEPPQLGPIEVRLSITNDQANLLFNAPHAVARDAIQTALPRLQEMLLESGVALGNVSIGAGNQQQRSDLAFRRSTLAQDDAASSHAVAPAGSSLTDIVRQGVGLVDLFA